LFDNFVPRKIAAKVGSTQKVQVDLAELWR